MKRKHVLITVFARAAWGGLHENVLEECRALVAAGIRVTVACAESRLAMRLRLAGADIVTVNWDQLELAVKDTHDAGNYDLVHAHPFLSRELGIQIAEAQGVPLVVTMHGNYLDFANSWFESAAHVICVSHALKDNFVSLVEKCDSSLLSVIPNGVSDEIFQRPMLSLEEKMSSGVLNLAVASRLDKDKTPLIQAVIETVSNIMDERADTKIKVKVLGDGSDADVAADSIRNAGATVEFVGWRMAEHVAGVLRESVLAICPGRSAAQSIAAGTPVIAAGSQGISGLQIGSRLSVGWWANFGGFPNSHDPGFNELSSLLESENKYAQAQSLGRSFMSARARQSTVNQKLLTLFETLY